MLRQTIIALLTGVVAAIAGIPCPEVKAEPVENGSLIRLRHNEAQPLTGFLIEIVDYPGNRFAYMRDELFGSSIAAGHERRIVVNNLMPGTVPDYLKVTAAVYANGTSCGTADKVKLIIDARRENRQLNRAIIGRIKEGLSAGASTENLTTDLTKWARSNSAVNSAVITHVVEQLKRTSTDKVLSALEKVEQILAASKPPL
jgi:hypothetical protein